MKNCSNIFYDLNPITKKLEKKVSPKCRQAYVALGPTLLTISLGMAEGFSAIFLPQLMKENHLWNITTDMESWIGLGTLVKTQKYKRNRMSVIGATAGQSVVILFYTVGKLSPNKIHNKNETCVLAFMYVLASIATISMPFACLVGGYAMEKIGRKMIHMVDCIICILGWLILYFSTDINSILVGRIISGFSVSLIAPSAGVYFAETSDPSFRSPLLALLAFAISFGISLSHLLGVFLIWRHVILISCVFPTLGLVITFFAPESPTFLIKNEKVEAGAQAFFWCRGTDIDSEKEWNILLERHLTSKETERKLSYKQYSKPEFIRPLLVMIVFFFTLQSCGANALVFYAVDILEQLFTGKNFDKHFSMITIDIIRVVFSLVALYLQKILNRRFHAISTIFGVVISLFTLSIFLFTSRSFPILLEKYNSVILIALVSYMMFLSVGLSPLPWTMIGEVFPLASKGVGNGIASCINFGFIFLIVKSTPFLFKTLGRDVAFFVYGVCTLVGLVVLVIFLPETKDKPLHQIEEDFKSIE